MHLSSWDVYKPQEIHLNATSWCSACIFNYKPMQTWHSPPSGGNRLFNILWGRTTLNSTKPSLTHHCKQSDTISLMVIRFASFTFLTQHFFGRKVVKEELIVVISKISHTDHKHKAFPSTLCLWSVCYVPCVINNFGNRSSTDGQSAYPSIHYR